MIAESSLIILIANFQSKSTQLLFKIIEGFVLKFGRGSYRQLIASFQTFWAQSVMHLRHLKFDYIIRTKLVLKSTSLVNITAFRLARWHILIMNWTDCA